MDTNQVVGLAMLIFFLLIVFGAVIKALGWKGGLACVVISVLGTVFVVVAIHLLKG